MRYSKHQPKWAYRMYIDNEKIPGVWLVESYGMESDEEIYCMRAQLVGEYLESNN